MGNRGTLIAELPVEERPRERLIARGARSLSTAELLAVLLGTGRRGESALDVAGRLLGQIGEIRDFVDAEVQELKQVPGVGLAKAVTILAALELGRRLQDSRADLHKITSPKDAADYFMDKLRFLRKEHLMTLHLDTKHQVLGEEIVSIGSLNSSIVHPREIFKTALKRSAAAIICAHNHPSGDPTPSTEDLEVTKRLVAAGQLLGIELLDHLIIGDNHYISLREEGMIRG